MARELPSDQELVILLDETGLEIGSMPKGVAHNAATPFHLAFSSYLFHTDGRFLMTRRSLGKRAWPGVWSNSCCGHPRPGEAIEEALSRRVGYELGLEASELQVVDEDFSYQAVDVSGIVENEKCPVYLAFVAGEPVPRPDEVEEWHWINWGQFVEMARYAPWVISPWAAMQAPRIVARVDSILGDAGLETAE
jgi:isopentenyl-diphosphate delta-isomerase